MGRIGKVIEAIIESASNLREIITQFTDFNYKKSPRQINPPGIDSVPLSDDQGVMISVGSNGKNVFIGIYPDPQAKPGEVRLYGRDSNGQQVSELLFNNAGEFVYNQGTDYAVAYEDLKVGFDTLKADFNNLITVFNAHVHSGVTTGGGSSAVSPTPGTPSTASIDASKVETVRLP